MESDGKNVCSVIQYYKGPDTESKNTGVILKNSFESKNSVEEHKNKSFSENDENNKIVKPKQEAEANYEDQKDETTKDFDALDVKKENIECIENEIITNIKIENEKCQKVDCRSGEPEVRQSAIKCLNSKINFESSFKSEEIKKEIKVHESVKLENDLSDIKIKETELETKDDNLELLENEKEIFCKGKKRTVSEVNEDVENKSVASREEANANKDGLDTDFDDDDEDGNENDEEDDNDDDDAADAADDADDAAAYDDEESDNKPRKRGRCKKNPDVIPTHLSSDMVLGYKILLKFLETPQFSGFHKPFKKSTDSEENCKITCLNQIKKKFEKNIYKKISEFVNDVREMLINIYESRNQVAIKKALRLEQILEQRIAQLPNYLRPQCALVLPSDEVNNCHNKIRITKGGGFVSLLLEKTEKKRYEKNKEKRKLLAEERKQLKEEQDKDVQEWEKNVLLKDFEEDIKSMWELPAIGHFIHLCADIFNIGEVAQFEVERMLLMPQCSDTLDLIMTALLTNSLVRAKLDRTPSMPYSIWGPLVRTRVMSWYRMWHRDNRNEQKIFEEIGIEPEFWQILGPEINPLDYYYFHEISLFQRVWILKTLCDVDFVRKKTVYDNIRAQTLDELNPVHLGLDQQGNRYIQFKQFSGSDIRIYRQSSKIEGDIMTSELIESTEGFEYREGPITAEKVFKDIWELNEKPEIKPKKKKMVKRKRVKNFNAKVTLGPVEKKNLRQSARVKQKTYMDWSDSDQSDTDLRTLRNKLLKSDTETLYRPFSNKEFISLSVFRLPREKVGRPTPKKTTYTGRRTEETARNESDKTVKTEAGDRKEDTKPSACEDEQSDSLDAKQNQNMSTDFDKNFHGDDINEDEFDLREKISNCELDGNDVKFTVKNLDNLKMVFKKGSSNGEELEGNISETLENSKLEENTSGREKEYDALYKYNVPNHLKPDSSKFYLVVDSVEGLRQLISKFGSHENDLEIITRSTKSRKKNRQNTSSEVKLIERLQNLLLELEPWELDLMKFSRLNKEKMYKEYMNFLNRPSDFVHPNEAYWMKTHEEPTSTTASTTATSTVTTSESNTSSSDKISKESCTTATASELTDVSQQDATLDILGPRKRTRVTRVQLQPESGELDGDFDDDDDGGDYESNESDDNWVLPTPKKRPKKETTNRTPKLPKRSLSKRFKSSPVEKTDFVTNTGEKSLISSPEKAKKALFWGPRSTDPSEDLNWETNRQKILEKHNSPIKKIRKLDEATNELSEIRNAGQNSQKFGSQSQSVIIASPKRYTTQAPGNKKPYFSSAQLNAVDSQGKKRETAETQHKLFGKKNVTSKPEVKSTGSNTSPDLPVEDSENKTSVKIQTYSRIKKAGQAQSATQTLNKAGQSPAKPGSSAAIISNSQVVRYGPQVCSITSGGGSEQKPISHIQIHQPGTRTQQIQIQDLGQSRIIASAANVKMQQAVQWPQKVITVQPVSQSGKIIQQQVQSQSPTQSQNQSQVQLQCKAQEATHGELQKVISVQQPIQVPPEKLGSFLQMVTSQGQTGALNPDGDLYITDGKNLMKFDNSFVQQLQKDKVVTLDLKKTLLLVKPKTELDQNITQGHPQISSSQQNILVINKPTTVQQTVATASVPNFVIPANYIIKEGNQQAQAEQGQQTVKIVQQSPAFVIQQKPIINKSLQPQVIKIITSQPMGTNQNIILTPVAGQVIQSVNQTSVTSEQQSKPSATLRLVRPQIASTITHNSVQPTVQSPIIVNNIVQIQGQRLDASKPQTSVVSGRIVSTAVPTVRMATPQTVLPPTQPVAQVKSVASTQAQAQTVVVSATLTPQAVRSNVITQPVRLATITQGQVSTPITANSNPRFVVSTTQAMRVAPTSQTQLQPPSSLSQTQSVRFVTNPQIATPSANNSQVIKPTLVNPQQMRLNTTETHSVIQTSSVNSQIGRPTTTINAQAVRLVSQPQLVQTQTLVVSTNTASQTSGSAGNLNSQSVKIVPPQQYQTQAVVPCVNINSPTVRLATSINSQPIRFVQSQPIRLIANNNVGVKFINRSPAPVKAAVITSAAQTPVISVSNVKPSGVLCQPVRYQTIMQTSGIKPVQNKTQLVPSKKSVTTNTVANTPIIIVEDEDETNLIGEKLAETPVTLDYINGELSVKKTSQGWKYAVKASNGKDIILTDEQIEERLKVNNGVMK